jgi:hypothetical protein
MSRHIQDVGTRARCLRKAPRRRRRFGGVAQRFLMYYLVHKRRKPIKLKSISDKNQIKQLFFKCMLKSLNVPNGT